MNVLNLPPLVVDLDGTLIYSDMLYESALKLLRDNPSYIFRFPLWLAKGRAGLKQRIAAHVQIDPQTLPYNFALIDWLKNQRANGRTLVLCTASDQAIANAIAAHLGIFDEVLASDGRLNLSGENKATLLEKRWGRTQFDYVGNAQVDLPVWKKARHAIVVNASRRTLQKAQQCCQIEQVFAPPARHATVWRRTLRAHQWLKNLLLFVPLFASHTLTNTDAWSALILAFIAFSLCASSVYIANDLLDLESDRLHPRKCHRPFASGLVPIWLGILLIPSLLIASLSVGYLITGTFLEWLIFYFILTCAYSWKLKRLVLVDCLTLAFLYTLRIITGAAAIEQPLSFWLLAFSAFFFLSLAFIKRYAELRVQFHNDKTKIHGRGYHTTDISLIQTMGIAAGYASVLVLALYLNSDAVLKLYRSPELIWGTIPVTLFWISWMWMQTHQGKMHDDPLVFAIKDRASLTTGVIFILILTVSAMGWSW